MQSHFLGVRADLVTRSAALESVRRRLVSDQRSSPSRIYFTNVHSIILARKSPSFARAIETADLVLPDGSGLRLAGQILSQPVMENLNGTDFIPLVLGEAEKGRWSVYLLGGRPEVVEASSERLKARFPSLNVVGYRSGYFKPEDEAAVISDINSKRPDILLVALGSPLQEMFLQKWCDRLKVKACFAVGGLFDFLSGNKKRAPAWMRSMGIEWAFRLVLDPKNKWKRTVIEIPLFLTMILTQRLFPQYSQRNPQSEHEAL